VRNAEITKTTLLEESGKLFNVKGYKATSISDITTKTGLTKGAIYRHFENKAELEKATLTYLINGMMIKLRQQIKKKNDAPSKLNALLDYFAAYTSKPPVHGGCPLINAAVEADHANPELKKVVNRSVLLLHNSIKHILTNGVKYNQLDSTIDKEQLASFIFSALEGGIILSQVTGRKKHLQGVVDELRHRIQEITK